MDWLEHGVYNDGGMPDIGQTPYFGVWESFEIDLTEVIEQFEAEIGMGQIQYWGDADEVRLYTSPDGETWQETFEGGVFANIAGQEQMYVGVSPLLWDYDLLGGTAQITEIQILLYAGMDANREIHGSLLVKRPNDEWVELIDYVTNVEVELGSIEDLGTGSGADIGVRTLDFSLHNDGTNRFATRDRNSEWNRMEGQYVPLLFPYREVKFLLAVTSQGESPEESDWVELFHGYLGDSSRTEGYETSVRCRDLSKKLLDTLIHEPTEYGDSGVDTPMESMIQTIIDDWVVDPPVVYVPVGGTGVTLETYNVEYISVWQAIQEVVKKVGWFLGYRWIDGAFRLALMEPPRDNKEPSQVLQHTDNIYIENLEIRDDWIRNAAIVSYYDPDQDEQFTLHFNDHPSYLRDSESKEKYGGFWRVMVFEEGEDSFIDTQMQALRFGQTAVSDLKDLAATNRLNIPILPELDVFDVIAVSNPLTSSHAQIYAIESIRHSLMIRGDNSRFRTEVIASDQVVGGRDTWLSRDRGGFIPRERR